MSLGKFLICGPGLRLAVRRNELAGEVAVEDSVPWRFPSVCGDGEWLNAVAFLISSPAGLSSEVSGGAISTCCVPKVVGSCDSLFTLTGLSSSSSNSSNDELPSLGAAFSRFRDLAVGI